MLGVRPCPRGYLEPPGKPVLGGPHRSDAVRRRSDPPCQAPPRRRDPRGLRRPRRRQAAGNELVDRLARLSARTTRQWPSRTTTRDMVARPS
ncbi:hypothetical protein [Ornithinimicrobium kibberense]|uniref:hypothetical protein n=1 Tax=Ornithinimicrobium kibberense TaxID=282060 RepID=UPI003606C617